MGRPKARRQNVRVLSRRSNLLKAVACGYSEGAGFAVLTEPSPLRFCSVRATTRRGGVGELSVQAPRPCARLAVSASDLRLSPVAGPTSRGTPRRRRGGDESSRRHRQGGVPVCLALLPLPGRPRAISRGRKMRAATASGAGRRLLATASASASPRRQRLPPCGFSHRGRGNGTAVAHARRHKALQARLRRRLLT